ncbi:hypothetical protein EDD22DRAFT_919129 [Suillus occidentalis]|nr:hypothetical protein EDD22DRAFT_919129 [Suillus occidentalis]
MFYIACSHLPSAFMLPILLCEHRICTSISSSEFRAFTMCSSDLFSLVAHTLYGQILETREFNSYPTLIIALSLYIYNKLCVGFLSCVLTSASMPDGSGILILKTFAIWYRERKFMAFKNNRRL